MSSPNPVLRKMLLFLVTVQFLLSGCGGDGAISSGDGPKPFDDNLAVELAYLSLQAYQQLNDYRSNRTFVLPPPYSLQEQFFTTVRFADEQPGSGEGLPIGFAAPEKTVIIVDGNQVKELAYVHVNSERVIRFGNPLESPGDLGQIASNHAMCNYYHALCDGTVDPVTCRIRRRRQRLFAVSLS